MRFTKDQCEIFIEPAGNNRRKIRIVPENSDIYLKKRECITAYPLELIELILKVKGPYGLCDEILRDEQPEYVQISLKYDLLSYVDQGAFDNKRILDFGCGSGASTAILGRMFPNTRIVGLEMNKPLLEIAKARAAYYQMPRISFQRSEDPLSFPDNLGKFDFVVLSAVYEHLLPQERRTLIPKLWSLLEPCGVMFINQTPHRFFPVETHTSGLPLINYLPDRPAHFYAKHFSKRNLEKADWPELLRRGIRGGSVGEVMAILAPCRPDRAVLMKPSYLGIKNRIDLWHVKMDRSKYPKIKEAFGVCTRLLSYAGITVLPHLSIAIQKTNTPSAD